MAEHFYSIHAPDEAAITYMNQNLIQQRQIYHHQQQQQQQHNQPQALFATNHLPNICSARDLNLLNQNTFYLTSGTEINNNNMEAVSWLPHSTHNKMFLTNSKNSNSNLIPKLNNTNNTGTYLHAGSVLFPSLTVASDDILIDNSFLSSGRCHYLPIASSTTSCYNRNRYTPYTAHNRPYAGAAANITHPQQHITNYVLNTTSVQMSMQPLISYNKRSMNSTITSVSSVTSSEVSAKTTTNDYEVNTSNTLQPNLNISTSAKIPTTKISNSPHEPNSNNVSNTITSTSTTYTSNSLSTSIPSSTTVTDNKTYTVVKDIGQMVTLQITNLDYTMDEPSLRSFLLGQLKPITPVISLTFEGSSYAKVTVPDLFFAKQVVSNLHRKKIGHKRMLVSYTRDSSLTEINTLRCQVAGLLKDVPYYTLPMYKFRELFQSRFKTSISVLDLYKMPDICTINTDSNDEKFISLRPELADSLDTSPLIEGLQHSVPYCTIHFKREQHKGWAEQEIEPLPNISMTISELQKIIYPLLNSHPGDIPIASLLHCIEGQLNIHLTPNENGVNLEHLVCCVQGIQIQVNNFGIKILGWIEVEKNKEKNIAGASCSATGITQTSIPSSDRNLYTKNTVADSLYLISREVIELIKMSPKSTMKFNRFIPAYHNHFGKQCRVADYGYTKLIELFEALSAVVQIMGDGENRQITLTHRTQVRRFTSDLLRVLRAPGNKSVLLSQLPSIFTQTQYRSFDITDYGVCDIIDILDGLVHSNIVVVSTVQQGKDILISMPRRKQTSAELEKTSVFAGEMVELFSTAPQYAILFQKFVRSYHYHFAYQCRLSDYGFLKLADLMESIQGIVEMELTNDEDKKIFLTPRVAQRVFAEQCEELIRCSTGSSKTCIKFIDVLDLHKKKYGYQIQPQTLGVQRLEDAIELLPSVEVLEKEGEFWIICHNEDALFRTQCYRAIKHLMNFNSEFHATAMKAQGHNALITSQQSKKSKRGDIEYGDKTMLTDFLQQFNKQYKENLTLQSLKAMRHFIEIYTEEQEQQQSAQNYVRLSAFSKFIINIVRCLEQRSNILLYDLKQAIDCHIGSTFIFGYPNLFSVLTAYPDLFAVNINISQERSGVTLLNNCELRSSPHHKGHSHISYATHLQNNHTNKLKSSIRTTRTAFSECNGRMPPTIDNKNVLGVPPTKARALAQDSLGGTSSNNITYRYPIYSQPSTKSAYVATNTPGIGKHFVSASSDQHISNSSMPFIYSTVPNNSTSLLNCSGSNKENSFDSILSTSLNSSSNSSFADSNCSLSAGNISSLNSSESQNSSYPNVKLWDRRQQHKLSSTYQQLQHQVPQSSNLPSIAPTYQVTLPTTVRSNNSKTASTSIPTEQLGIYEFISNVQKCPNYEPPKPDTPPSENMPFWIDPIWMHNVPIEQQTHEMQLNIKLPEMKIFNVLPILLSPYTLSKTENMKQVFNFENHDRKIA